MFTYRKKILDLSRAFSSWVGKQSVEVINVPFSGGQTKKGVDLAPNFLRDVGFYGRLKNIGLKLSTAEAIDLEHQDSEHQPEVYVHNQLVKNPTTCGHVSRQTADAVFKALKEGKTAIVIGGDHSIATGTTFGHYLFNKNTCLLWVDAHADINSPLITTSGNIHGMPVSWIIKGFPSFPVVPGYEWVHRCIPPSKIAYVGLRDVEPQEQKLLNDLGITAFYIKDIDELGIVTTMQKALEQISPNNECPIHVSFDIDAMDPEVAPTTGTAVRGGLTLSEGLYIAQAVAETGKLQGLDLVEINPRLGDGIEALRTAETGMQIVEAMLGKHVKIPEEDLIPYNEAIKAKSNK
ncbi:arginase-1-like [Actinia tenebrosa]|uniref:Arginase n=1 Tax=Actinia tenebrosa TaxID=6105 RepID=A0A6P8IYM1_ACTTE|nr:arginase-1-like [Actinia tenebrosa]